MYGFARHSRSATTSGVGRAPSADLHARLTLGHGSCALAALVPCSSRALSRSVSFSTRRRWRACSRGYQSRVPVLFEPAGVCALRILRGCWSLAAPDSHSSISPRTDLRAIAATYEITSSILFDVGYLSDTTRPRVRSPSGLPLFFAARASHGRCAHTWPREWSQAPPSSLPFWTLVRSLAFVSSPPLCCLLSPGAVASARTFYSELSTAPGTPSCITHFLQRAEHRARSWRGPLAVSRLRVTSTQTACAYRL